MSINAKDVWKQWDNETKAYFCQLLFDYAQETAYCNSDCRKCNVPFVYALWMSP